MRVWIIFKFIESLMVSIVLWTISTFYNWISKCANVISITFDGQIRYNQCEDASHPLQMILCFNACLLDCSTFDNVSNQNSQFQFSLSTNCLMRESNGSRHILIVCIHHEIRHFGLDSLPNSLGTLDMKI